MPLATPYIKLFYDDYRYDVIQLDRQRGSVWQLSTGRASFSKIRTTDGALLLNQQSPDVPDWETTGIDWAVWYLGVSQMNGHIYINEDENDQGTVRCLDGTTLVLLHTSPPMSDNIYGLWVHDPYVYAVSGTVLSSPTRDVTTLARFPLDLSVKDWEVQLWELQTGSGFKPVSTDDTLTVDGAGNVWHGARTELYRVSPAGTVMVFSLAAHLPSTAMVHATGYDADTNTLVIAVGNDAGSPQDHNAGLARFNLATNSFLSYVENASWFVTPGNGGSRPCNWSRLPNGRVWLRLRPPGGGQGDFAEIDTRTATQVRQVSLTADWGLSDTVENGGALDAARGTSGYVWDDCACAVWLYNGAQHIYPDAESTAAGAEGWYGIWKLTLPDLPAADCPAAAGCEPLPEWIAYGATGGPEWGTALFAAPGGWEQRAQLFAQVRGRWDVSFLNRTTAEIATLVAFFRAVAQGKARAFCFQDWRDHTFNNIIGTGDGTTSAFQLVKVYISGSLSYARPLSRVVLGSLVVTVNGVLTTAYTVTEPGGLVQFDAPPPSGAVIHASGDFEVLVRLETDSLQITCVTSEVFSCAGLGLVELIGE